MLEKPSVLLYNVIEITIGDDVMYADKSIIKIINKKYFLNEFIYILKSYTDSYEVLVIDNLNTRIYLEDNYPFSLLKESKIKEYAKKEFLSELNDQTRILLNDKFPTILDELSSYDEQQSLF